MHIQLEGLALPVLQKARQNVAVAGLAILQECPELSPVALKGLFPSQAAGYKMKLNYEERQLTECLMPFERCSKDVICSLCCGYAGIHPPSCAVVSKSMNDGLLLSAYGTSCSKALNSLDFKVNGGAKIAKTPSSLTVG